MAFSNNQNNGTMCFTKSTLAAGTTTTLSQSAAATYSINGKIYIQGSAWSNTATPTTQASGKAFVPVPRGYGSVFVIGADKDGNMKVEQGEVVPLFPTGGNVADIDFLTDKPQFPEVPDTVCPLGYMILKIGANLSATSWTFGASNLASLTGSTKTFVDCSVLPDRPQ